MQSLPIYTVFFPYDLTSLRSCLLLIQGPAKFRLVLILNAHHSAASTRHHDFDPQKHVTILRC